MHARVLAGYSMLQAALALSTALVSFVPSDANWLRQHLPQISEGRRFIVVRLSGNPLTVVSPECRVDTQINCAILSPQRDT